MKREKLNVLFDKAGVSSEISELLENSHLTNSDIARAAMNYGLECLVPAKTSMNNREFDGFIAFRSQENE